MRPDGLRAHQLGRRALGVGNHRERQLGDLGDVVIQPAEVTSLLGRGAEWQDELLGRVRQRFKVGDLSTKFVIFP